MEDRIEDIPYGYNEIVWEDEYFQVIYTGICREGNYWGVKVCVKNKADYKLSICVSSIDIKGKIIDVFPYVEDLLPHEQKIKYIGLLFEKTIPLRIRFIEDMEGMKLHFFCMKDNEKISESPEIELKAVNYIKDLEKRMQRIIEEIDKGIIWKKEDDDYPSEVCFDFVYPNGKHGDIDMYLGTKYGITEQSSSITFNEKISTKYKDIIELMVMFYNVQFSQNVLKINRNNDDTVLEFLRKYHNIVMLDKLYMLASPGRNLTALIKNPTMSKAYDIIHNKYVELKKRRSEIYQELIVQRKTTSKWKSEQQLYCMVREFYADAIFQYQTEWLGRQSLDIYIPSLKVGIEYQGQQHYQPVSLFGKEENLGVQQARDLRKKKLCAENGIKLFEWKYDIIINQDNFKKFLEKL